MEDIQIGNYIRTNEGISRIQIVEHNRIFDEYNNCYFIDDIIKISSYKIDLVEVGDYVNGEKVVSIIDYDYKRIVTEIAMFRGMGRGNYYIDDKDIKNIVTKEQFAQCRYDFEEE